MLVEDALDHAVVEGGGGVVGADGVAEENVETTFDVVLGLTRSERDFAVLYKDDSWILNVFSLIYDDLTKVVPNLVLPKIGKFIKNRLAATLRRFLGSGLGKMAPDRGRAKEHLAGLGQGMLNWLFKFS